MKKDFKFLPAALAVASMGFIAASCDDDCDHESIPPTVISIVGTWYDEVNNEEVRYSASGTFYDKYSLPSRCDEIEGRYIMGSDGKSFTYSYGFLGNEQFEDMKIDYQDEWSLSISSANSTSVDLQKVVETYNMQVGKTQQVSLPATYPGTLVRTYASTNERIASVSEDGLISANGEKGTAYIKLVTDVGTIWVKVVVGDECYDLWYDYISMFGVSYYEMASVLGAPVANDGNQGYFWLMDYHDLIEQLSIWLNPRTRKVEYFNLWLRDGIPAEVIRSYMETRYYEYTQIGRSIQYLSGSTVESSAAILEYNQEENVIIIADIDYYLCPWPEFTKYFGSAPDEIRSAALEQQLEFDSRLFVYSSYGSDLYWDTFASEMVAYEFVFNKHDEMIEYWSYLHPQADLNTVFASIKLQYQLEETHTEGNYFYATLYNADQTAEVELKVKLGAFSLGESYIIYRDLTLEGLPMLPDYTSDFGKTLSQIESKFGELFYGSPMYTLNNKYIDFLYFYMDAVTGKSTAYALYLHNNATQAMKDEIHQYLSTEYTHYATSGLSYAYRDGATLDESALMVVFNSEIGAVMYYDLATYGKSSSQTIQMDSFPSINAAERPTILQRNERFQKMGQTLPSIKKAEEYSSSFYRITK